MRDRHPITICTPVWPLKKTQSSPRIQNKLRGRDIRTWYAALAPLQGIMFYMELKTAGLSKCCKSEYNTASIQRSLEKPLCFVLSDKKRTNISFSPCQLFLSKLSVTHLILMGSSLLDPVTFNQLFCFDQDMKMVHGTTDWQIIMLSLSILIRINLFRQITSTGNKTVNPALWLTKR